jgi:hypothetical protein
MSDKDLVKIQDLLVKLRQEADFCIKRINELEKELSTGSYKSSVMGKITDPVRGKNVAKLLEDIGYEAGDSLRKAIKKLEDYIIEGGHVDFTTLSVIPNKIMAKALDIPEDEEISYEELIGKVPKLFKALM